MLIKVNGIELFYEMQGSGPPLIMLHGNGETHEIFDKAIPLLAKSFTVYAPDTRGHGQSGAVSEYHYADMAEDFRCFIEALGLEKPVLYGFSDGGIIGLLLASELPELLSKLVVSGANTNPGGLRRGWQRFFKVLYKINKDPKMKMMEAEPNITAEDLEKIKIPTLVLAGSRDMIRQEHTELIAKSITNSRLKILKSQGHGSYIVHKETIASLLLDFC